MAVTATALAIAAIATTAIGTGVATYSAVQQGRAQEAASKYSAAVDRNNAQMAADRARFESERIRKRNLLVRGRQRAAYAKSGVEISGTPDDVMFDSELEGELDLLASQYVGAVTARGYEARARLSDAAGENARTNSYYNAGATILSGAGSVASQSAYAMRQNNPRF